MTLDFLTCDPMAESLMAESPMSAATSASGATFDTVDGWRMPVSFRGEDIERQAVAAAVGWADASHLRKTEVTGAPGPLSDIATVAGGAWWCQTTPTRTLVLGGALVDPYEGIETLDVTAQFAAVRIGGPLARDVIARFCALDLRAVSTPVGAFRPGSVARTPGLVLCTAPDQFLLLTGAALAEHLWTVVTDAGTRLGGQPVGSQVLAGVTETLKEATPRA